VTAAAEQSAAAGQYQSPAAAAATAAAANQSDDETESADAAIADLAAGTAAQTSGPLPTTPQTNAAGTTPTTSPKAAGTTDQATADKSAAATDPSSLGGTSTAGSNPQTQPQVTSVHSTASTAADPQRAQELVDRVTNSLRTALDTGGEMRVRLEPPALGRVQVDVSSGSGGVTARLEVQTASARQTLLDNISLLHTAITQTGATVSRIDVVVAPQPKDDSGSERQSSSGGQQQASTEGDSQGGSQNPSNGQKQNQTGGLSSSIDELDIEV
jgi:flagellar hook-length control protein FliK